MWSHEGETTLFTVLKLNVLCYLRSTTKNSVKLVCCRNIWQPRRRHARPDRASALSNFRAKINLSARNWNPKINLFFHDRFRFFSCFSLAIASSILPMSQINKLVAIVFCGEWIWITLLICSGIVVKRSEVTPMYKTWWWTLVKMQLNPSQGHSREVEILVYEALENERISCNRRHCI